MITVSVHSQWVAYSILYTVYTKPTDGLLPTQLMGEVAVALF